MNKLLIMGLFLSLFGCATIPKKAEAVKGFNADQYLGKWYEIARFDFRFEKNLNNTTAEYSKNEDGTIKVINKGYNYVKKEWTSAEGKAKFVKDAETAMLKVSFFGPFYSGYNVIELDKDYQYALVAGESLKYLWILSRTPSLPNKIKEKYIQKAREIGYKTENLVWVSHDGN
ncbi:lipocalin [Brumimicrobium salinarum]|uniref:Outer membrane lipoprotein Blc n=1 Tax=Brumimicrobium salinarum TaxID=2058658 RepID=A0A2I0R1F5_9FLAO|nr:lipocalin family protein [Brumimicrobium salinarum]PKR80414.1 lipocalin [Brumimicrobium salinarum]